MARVQSVGRVWSESRKNNPKALLKCLTEEIRIKNKYLEKYEFSESQEIKDLNLTIEDRICAICLMKIKKQSVGRVSGCKHLFCASCLIEWFNCSNVCPLDREPHRSFVVCKNILSALDLNVDHITKVKGKNYCVYDIGCGICHSVMRSSQSIMCDSCRMQFHIGCINPPVKGMTWRDPYCCPDCWQQPIHRSTCFCSRCHKENGLRCKQVKIIRRCRSLQQKSLHKSRSLLSSRYLIQKLSTNIFMLRRYLPWFSRLKLLDF